MALNDASADDFTLPSYMMAANNHNIGNLNEDWASPPSEMTTVAKVTNFLGASALSGLNSFYNTALWAGNMFSDKDVQYRDTKDLIASFDEDMAKYYDENRQAADLVGFVATSFIPGLGGIRVFNAGAKALMAAREGVMGVNMARGLGVLPGARNILMQEAIEGYTTSQAAFAFTEARTIKAIASGFGEQVLQAAAFEVAVAATMKKSPILNDMDVGDMVSNIAWGAVVGGAIGGAIEGAITTYGIKRAIRATDAKLTGVTQANQGVAGTSASDNALIRRNDLENTQINAPEGVAEDLYRKAYEDKVRHIDEQSRRDFTTIAGGDAATGNQVYEALRVAPTSKYSEILLGLEEIAPYADTAKLVKKYSLQASEGAEEAGKFAGKNLKMWGEDAGKLSDEAPAAIHLADTLKKGESIEVRSNKVKVGSETFRVRTDEIADISTMGYREALARHIWANDDTVPKLVLPRGKTSIDIGINDIPLLTKAHREGFMDFNLVLPDGSVIDGPTTREAFTQMLAARKNELAVDLMRAKKGNIEEVANQLDTPVKYLTGEEVPQELERGIFGLRNAQVEYYNRYVANTDAAASTPVESVKPWLKQQNFRMIYNTEKLSGVDNFNVEAMTLIAQRQKLNQAANERAVASVLGEDASLLPEFSEAQLRAVNRGGAGSGFVSFTNANYGSAGALAEYVGAQVTKLTQANTEKVALSFSSVNSAIVNSPADTTRLATIMQKVRAAGTSKYVISDSGEELVLKSVRDYERALARGEEPTTLPAIPPGVDETIPFGSDAVKNWIGRHIEFTANRNQKFNSLRHSKGFYDDFDPSEFYPPAPNPERFTHHAFVRDSNRITSTNHTSMLYADSAENLAKQIDAARAQGYEVFTKGETAAYYRARGEYDYSRGFNDNLIDASLQRSGASAPSFPLTGKPEEIMQDIMQWHKKQEDILVREAVSTKYSRQFGILQAQGEKYIQLETSRAGGSKRFAAEATNPYGDYVKTFLGVSRVAEYPVWKAVNNVIDTAGTKVWNAVSSIFNNAKSPYDLGEVNKILGEYGVTNAATPAQMEAWVNHPAGRGVVSKFISQQNSLLSTLILRLDPINALNNAVGSTVLTGAETKAVIRAIESGNAEAVGELAGISRIQLPGVDDSILSPQKMIAKAYSNFFADGKNTLIEKYKQLGVITDTPQQFKLLLDEVTIDGTETAAQLNSKMERAFSIAKRIGDTGEQWTGNKLAEQMNRFVSANVMDQITSVAVKHGLMDERTAASYINTFVNRTQGNVIASQRPQMFQGPLGQAIGLFQSYQFNIMQQLLRYVGEGSRKDALTLLGLQSTMYGANGLPAFQAINTHIIGTASGNREHTDAYSSIYNVAGKAAGDWLTYGLSSNFLIHPDLKLNLYSRGDINPRTVTIVPTNIADVPVVGAWSKLFTSVKNAYSAASNGGDLWRSFLGGVEQQGINRPLSGIARVARGAGEQGISFSASGKGNISGANDFYSLANLVRVTGAKPLDEAVATDAVFRVQTYSAADKAKRDALGKAVRTVVTGGGTPSEEQMEKFVERYAAAGGKQEEFSKWYTAQLRQANTPQANAIVAKTDTPYSRYMQEIMGGRTFKTPNDIINERQTVGE